MKQKNILIVVIIIAIIAVLFVVGKSKNKTVPTESTTNSHSVINSKSNETIENKLSAGEILYDFSTISMKDGNVSKIFKVSNLTNNDIMLERVVTSCMCTVAYVVNGEKKKGPFGMPGHGGVVPKVNDLIAVGETRDIEVIFDPNAHGPAGIGLIERVVVLTDSAGGILELKFKAIVTP